eukprot:312975-Chlamydomonas_euryale.AAC.1
MLGKDVGVGSSGSPARLRRASAACVPGGVPMQLRLESSPAYALELVGTAGCRDSGGAAQHKRVLLSVMDRNCLMRAVRAPIGQTASPTQPPIHAS